MSEKPTKPTRRPQPRDHSRPRRGGQSAAGSDGGHAEALHPAQRVEQGRGAEVADVIVGEVQHVHARVGGDLLQGRRAAAEVVLLVRDLLPARRDRAFEVPEGDVGATKLTPDPAPGKPRPPDRHHVGDAIAEVDVADGVERDRPRPHADRPRRRRAGRHGAQPVGAGPEWEAHPQPVAPVGGRLSRSEASPLPTPAKLDRDPGVGCDAQAAQRQTDPEREDALALSARPTMEAREATAMEAAGVGGGGPMGGS